MCGIAGFVDEETSPAEREAAVHRMCSAMIHRGPDDGGMESKGSATLGMRRLAIFDPANGHQPMKTRDGRYTLVFNGAIYNFRDLQAQLEAAGHVFLTQCDTEILLVALVHWGEAALDRLRGMFAFALWDAGEKTLFAARDPFGIKPLYFSRQKGRLLFASEVNALLASGAVAPEIDLDAVSEYLSWLAVPAPPTIYNGISSLQPGEVLIHRGGQVVIRAAWSYRTIPKNASPCASMEEFTSGLRERLDNSIQAHLLADVPIGAFLSGGLDSAVIVGLMSKISGDSLKTFSIGFEEDEYTEADEAELSARHFGSVHHTRIVTGDEVARDIDKIIAACDQPTGDGINTYYASETARQGGVKVALSGLGGDELFGGYPSFTAVPKLSQILPYWRVLPGSMRSMVTWALNKGDVRSRKLADFLKNAKDVHEVAALHRRVFSETSRASLLSVEASHAIHDTGPFHSRLSSLREAVANADMFSIVSAWETRTYMADVLLRDSDVMSMRHSIELRVPFVDRPLIEWLWNQPAKFKTQGKRPKSVLVAAARDVLPAAMSNRVKRGFTLPFPRWMRKDLRPFIEETFSAASVGKSGLFSVESVQRLWSDFVVSGDNREWSRVWSLAVLIAFLNRSRANIPLRPMSRA